MTMCWGRSGPGECVVGCLDASAHTALVAFLVLRPRPHCRASTLLSSSLATSHPLFSFSSFLFSPCSRADPVGSPRWPSCSPTRLSPIAVLLFSLSTLPRLHIHPGAVPTRLSTILQTERAPIAGIAQMRMIWISSGSRNRFSYFQGSISRFFSTTSILISVFIDFGRASSPPCHSFQRSHSPL